MKASLTFSHLVSVRFICKLLSKRSLLIWYMLRLVGLDSTESCICSPRTRRQAHCCSTWHCTRQLAFPLIMPCLLPPFFDQLLMTSFQLHQGRPRARRQAHCCSAWHCACQLVFPLIMPCPLSHSPTNCSYHLFYCINVSTSNFL